MTIQDSSNKNSSIFREIDIICDYDSESLRVNEEGLLETYQLSLLDSSLLFSSHVNKFFEGKVYAYKEAEEKVLRRISHLSEVVCEGESGDYVDHQRAKLSFLRGLKKIHKMHENPSRINSHTYEVLLPGIARQIDEYREAYETWVFGHCSESRQLSIDDDGELCFTEGVEELSLDCVKDIVEKARSYFLREVSLGRFPTVEIIVKLDAFLNAEEPFHSVKEEYCRFCEGVSTVERVIEETIYKKQRGSGSIASFYEDYHTLINALETIESIAKCKHFDTRPYLKEYKNTITKKIDSIRAQLRGISEKCLSCIAYDVPEIGAVLAKTIPFIEETEQSLAELIHYQSTRSFLYVDEETLCKTSTYTFARFDETVQTEVIEFIQQRLKGIVEVVKEGKIDNDELEKLYVKIINGLTALQADYEASYSEFSASIGLLKNEFEQQLCFVEPSGQSTIFDLFNAGCLTYTTDALRLVLSQIYGEALVSRVIDTYLEEGVGVVNRTTLKLLICAIATDVSLQDLHWLKGQSGFEKKSHRQLLNHFREAPDGRRLLDYLSVPVTQDKHNVADEYLETLPAENKHQSLRIVALETLADMESAILWQADDEIVMSDEDAITALQRFVLSKISSYEFNSDYYVNFLNVAAALITCIQSDKEVDGALLTAVLHKVDHMHAGAISHYTEKYCGRYARYWELLSDLLKLPEKQTTESIRLLIKGLKRHPYHQTEGQVMSIDEYSERMKLPEFFARKVGYWNKHTLQRSVFLDDSTGDLKDESVKNLRKGSLVESLSGGEPIIWELCEVYNEKGVVCQVFLPIDIERYKQKGESVPLWVTYQGTIGQSNSYSRDTEVVGPGNSFWTSEEQVGLMKRLCDPVMERLEGVTFDIWTTGHSLGGADSMNGCSQLAEAYCESALVNTINCTTFNTAGMTKEAANKFRELLGPKGVGAAKRGWIIHSLVRGDVVETSGQTKLGRGMFDEERVIFGEVKNHCSNQHSLYDALDKHCNLVYAKSSQIQPLRVLHPELHQREIRKYLKGIGRSSIHFLNVADETLDKHWLTQAVPNFFGGVKNLVKGVFSFRSMKTKEELAKDITNIKKEISRVEGLINDKTLSWFQKIKGDKLSDEQKEELEKLEEEKTFLERRLWGNELELARLNRLTEKEYLKELKDVEEANAYATATAAFGMGRLASIPSNAWYGDHRFQLLEETD